MLYKKLLIFLLFFFAQHFVFGQIDIPLDMLPLDENLFDQNILKSKEISYVSCVGLELKLNNLTIIDTLETFYLSFDQNYRPIYSEHFYIKNNQNYECKFFYSGIDRIKRCSESDSIKQVDNTMEEVVYLYNYFFKHDNLLTFEEKVFFPKSNKIINKKLDTLVYSDNKVLKEINYWFNPMEQSLMDSIIKEYRYDSLGQLIEYSINPSISFNKNIPLSFSKLYSPRAKYLYSYINDIKKVTEYHYYDYLPIDSFVMNKYEIKNINFKDYLQLKMITDKYGVSYNMFYIEPGTYSFENGLGSIKKIEYFEGSSLPKNIFISTDDKLVLYNFIYSK